MLTAIVKNYELVSEISETPYVPHGTSAAPKDLIFSILTDNSKNVEVLDIGFGTGGLARIIKQNPETAHWQIDGIDGWEPNCKNINLIGEQLYRNIWQGLVQSIDNDDISKYKIICLLDVIEHLDVDTAKMLIKMLLSKIGDTAFLFVSTPLWFYPQDTIQENDLAEHLIGVPASSMMAMIPTMYSFNEPLVGGFVYCKLSLPFVDFFNPTSNKNFSYDQGIKILKAMDMPYESGVVYKTSVFNVNNF